METTTEPNTSKIRILVSLGTCGIASGGKGVYQAFEAMIKEGNLADRYELVTTGCMGLCHSEPSIELFDQKNGKSIIYGNVKESQIPIILEKGLGEALGVKPIPRTWYYPEDEENTQGVKQARIVLRNCGRINPEKIDEYLQRSGYQAMEKVLTTMSPDEVIKVIEDSGLRGRGGGGFPTGKKWRFAANQKSDQKYIICNADEGDPGAFMDRAVLEGDPHAVLEAMAIAGYAIGADTGIIYVRAEYPLAVKRLQAAIVQAEERKLLGKGIFGKFDFTIKIKFGAGAFVCGEETALIHSIEGLRGEPTYKPPFPAVQGLWKKPTIVNNVETLASIAAIIRKGAAWFKAIGLPDCTGTKVFALAGKINKVGLIEVPMGISLRDIIFDLGQGIRGNRAFKAAQTGGPSGGCLTTEHLDTKISYESLRALGSMMGSGGMIVMDQDDCMVNVAKFYLEFTLDESCGKCTPCRIGNKRLHEMLESICKGNGTRETLNKLMTLSEVIKDTSLCGLGQSSPNPVLSTIRNFEAEYLAHIDQHTCPAGSCKDLIKFVINDHCTGCMLCLKNCPVHCITGQRKQMHAIDQEACIKCGVCFTSCRFHAIDRIS